MLPPIRDNRLELGYETQAGNVPLQRGAIRAPLFCLGMQGVYRGVRGMLGRKGRMHLRDEFFVSDHAGRVGGRDLLSKLVSMIWR